MAVLAPPIHIKTDTNACIKYIQDREKTIAGDQTMRVMRYMQSHALEEISSVGYNGCSGIREVAVEQFRHAEELYRQKHPARKKQITKISIEQYLESNHKKKLPKHIKPDEDGMITITKTETIAEHLIFSLHTYDEITSPLFQKLCDKFMEHPYFKNHPALSNQHWNTDEKHIHILISNFSFDGSRKLSLSGTKLRELRRYLDLLCYEFGLSIVDTKEARLDPEHSKWLDEVKAEGKIIVWDEKKVGGNWKHNRNQKDAEIEEGIDNSYIRLENKALAKEIEKKELITRYNPYIRQTYRTELPDELLAMLVAAKDAKAIEEAEERAIRAKKEEEAKKTKSQVDKIYYVRRHYYSRPPYGYRHPPLIVSIFALAKLIVTGESKLLDDYYPKKYTKHTADTLYAPVDKFSQDLIDSIDTSRDLNIRIPSELDIRKQQIGSRIGKVKRAIAYDKKTIANGEKLYFAISVLNNPNSAEEQKNAAYHYLASNGLSKKEKRDDLVLRYTMAQKRLADNERHLEDLNKDYRRLAKSDATFERISAECSRWNQAAKEAVKELPDVLLAKHQVHDKDHNTNHKPSLASIVDNAEKRFSNNNKNQKEAEHEI